MSKFSDLLYASRKDPKKALKVASIKALSVAGNKDYEKFIILTKARSGSNLLVSFLNSHPNVYCEGEVFWKLEGRPYEQILEKSLGKQPWYVKAKGFKIFYFHPLDAEECGVWNDLEAMKDVKVIHLQRKNILKSLISMKIALQSDEWMSTHNNKNKPPRKAVHIPETQLRDLLEKTDDRIEKGNELFKDHQMINVFYEDFVSDTEEYFRILDFLGVKRIAPRTVLERQNPESMYQLVENYAELKSAFADTKWAHMFVD